jgi:isopenicillin N synthase-like dioxygenase
VSAAVPLVELAGRDAVAQVAAACRDTGFFVVADHGLGDQLAATFAAARTFFALPPVEKQRSAMVGNDGYAGIGSARSAGKEMFDVGMSAFDRWPDVEGFRAAIEGHQAAGVDVARELLRTVALGLDVDPEFFARRMRRPQCFLRLLRYPPTPAGSVTTGGHTDYGAITLLATDGVPGLEVRRRNGVWAPVDAPAGSLVVNLGDMLARWTNDRYVSTPHRVVSSGEERWSVPLFVNPDPDTLIECIPSCVTPERPCRYSPITAGEFLQARIDDRITLDDDPRPPDPRGCET